MKYLIYIGGFSVMLGLIAGLFMTGFEPMMVGGLVVGVLGAVNS